MIVDEFSRECLAIDVGRRMTSEDVLERPAVVAAAFSEFDPTPVCRVLVGYPPGTHRVHLFGRYVNHFAATSYVARGGGILPFTSA